MSHKTCPQCRGTMEEGFLVDRGHYDYVKPSDWIEGTPETSFWTGTKTKGKERHPVVAWRCESCGLLQFYAPAGAAATPASPSP